MLVSLLVPLPPRDKPGFLFFHRGFATGGRDQPHCRREK